MTDDELDATVRFGYEVGHLSRCPRGGWLLAGVPNPESVAEHSHRTGVLAYLIAALEGADEERAATLGLFHDVPETRTTDLHSIAKQNVTAASPVRVADAQTHGMDTALAATIGGLIHEVEQRETIESVCAKDADRLDCLLRAREYQEQTGNSQLQPFVDNMAAGMRTATGRALADRAQKVEPRAWWFETAAAYGLPGQ